MKILTVKDGKKHCQNSFIKSDNARNIQAKGESILILCCCPVYMLGILRSTGKIDQDFCSQCKFSHPKDFLLTLI